MHKFIKNTKGAVTVIVTLLLIPAMLVSGTAVDLARIHTARSIIQDANQMAANSVLTQYNALLYDLYGLMGVAKDDPILAELLDSYIKVSVFGEEPSSNALGTLQLFYGADIKMDGPSFPENKNLREADVLRRQIEEYMKFRGPVLIVKEFIEALEGNKVKEDAMALDKKLQIESAIADMYEKYKELYDAINAADLCKQAVGGIGGGSFGSVSSTLKLIREQFVNLQSCYASWKSLHPQDQQVKDQKSDYEAKYKAILNNIKSYTVGGSTGSNWDNGRWRSNGASQGINKTIENAKQQGEDFKAKFDATVNISREIDGLRDELLKKIDELETKINNDECSEDIKKAFTEKTGTPAKSMIERYRDILKWDNIAAMSTSFKNDGYSYIDNEYKPLLDSVKYRNANSPFSESLSRSQLEQLPSSSQFRLSDSVSASNSKAAVFAAFPASSVTYEMPPGFKKFAELSSRNNDFFNELKEMMSQSKLPPIKLYDGQKDEDGEDSKEKQENIINSVLELVENTYNGLTNNPLGADSINDSATPAPEKLGILEIVTLIPKALSDPVVNTISDPLGSLGNAGDYILLLTYSTSMFSNYTTTKPESVGKTKDDLDEIKYPNSITGVPISPKVNYFFQSEWEYLYSGNDNAGENLSAITRLLFLVRLICNYIKVFSVSEITGIVNSIRAAFAWAPPIGLVLGELARAAFVAAESLVDVASLRSGHKVPLLKNITANEWLCSPSGIIKAISDAAADAAGGKDEKKEEKGLTYSQYMLFFFITKGIFYIGKEENAATELATRVGNLIEWNVINYKRDVKCDESKMATALGADDRFKLVDMKTDFSITTSVNMRMLFLSMGFAQGYSDKKGIGMPTSMPIVVTDYRGY
ncbi:MAG: DUF5702 domain-containing protein [Oscillospiraceae bacterium]|nr:DUF5702 domain-containing protein [Oscillospiraceae bacterium]